MSHIWSSQVGAISQHCSQGASPGTACTNTCSLGKERYVRIAFSHTLCHTNTTWKKTHTHTHIGVYFLLSQCVGRWKVNIPVVIQPKQPFRKLYGADRKRVNPPPTLQPHALSTCLASLRCCLMGSKFIHRAQQSLTQYNDTILMEGKVLGNQKEI